MYWIKSGIENHSKSEVIGHCDGDEKTEWPRRTDKSRTLKNKTKKQTKKTDWAEVLHVSICLFLLQEFGGVGAGAYFAQHQVGRYL